MSSLYEEGPCVNLSFEKGRASTSGSCLAQPWRVSSRWVVGTGLISLSPPRGRTRLIGVRSGGAAP